MKKTISPKARQIETGVRLRQICSLNIRRSTVSGNICELTKRLGIKWMEDRA